MNIFYKYFWRLVVVGISLSCNAPDFNKLKEIQSTSEGLYALPFTKFSYNTNSLFDDFFENNFGDFIYNEDASKYNSDIEEEFEKEVLLGNRGLEISVNPDATDEIEVNEVSLLSGDVILNTRYSSTVALKIVYSIPNLVDVNGVSFEREVLLDIGQNQEVETEIDVSGYKITVTNGKLSGSRRIIGIIRQETKQITTQINGTIQLKNLKYEYLKGAFGNYKTPISAEALSLTELVADVPNAFSFGKKNHRLLMDFINPFSIPVYLEFDELKVFYADGTFKNLELYATVDGVRAKNLIRLDPAIEETDGTLSFVRKTVTFDELNSNVAQIFSGRIKDFSYISISVKGEVNRTLEPGDKRVPGIISGKLDLSINVRGDIPIRLQIN